MYVSAFEWATRFTCQSLKPISSKFRFLTFLFKGGFHQSISWCSNLESNFGAFSRKLCTTFSVTWLASLIKKATLLNYPLNNPICLPILVQKPWTSKFKCGFGANIVNMQLLKSEDSSKFSKREIQIKFGRGQESTKHFGRISPGIHPFERNFVVLKTYKLLGQKSLKKSSKCLRSFPVFSSINSISPIYITCVSSFELRAQHSILYNIGQTRMLMIAGI